MQTRRRTAPLLFCLAILFASSVTAELPLLKSLSALSLEVVGTETVARLESPVTGMALVAPEGCRLYVVTLRGNIVEPCRIPLSPQGFAAVYEVPEAGKPGAAVGISRSEGTTGLTPPYVWNIPSHHKQGTFTSYVRKTGPLTLKAVFVIPASVKSFSVTYPALVSGEATVPLLFGSDAVQLL